MHENGFADVYEKAIYHLFPFRIHGVDDIHGYVLFAPYHTCIL